MIARDEALAALAGNEFDVLVIGGGITGAGVALDAATRGYSVALLERTDFAAGTSSRSSKLVHGGLRYLQNFDLGLVREALLERQLLVALAPHLVRPLPLVVPAFAGARPDRLMGVGLNLYDVMSVERGRLRGRRGRRGRAERASAQDGAPTSVAAGSGTSAAGSGASAGGSAASVGGSDASTATADEAAGSRGAQTWSPERHRMIGGEEVLKLVPALAAREPSGGYLFYDCQTDDARLVLTVLGEAERFGAVCANRVGAVDLLERDGRACGVRALDAESGETFEIQAASVVNATGVWADELRPQELHDEAELPRIRPSRGTHVTLSHDDLPLVGGAIVPAAEGRSIFALPWLGRTLVGTTDNDYEGPLEHVRPAAEDVTYLLDAVNAFFATDLGVADLTGAYAGVRPLISTGDPKKSVDISRKAELYETSSGMITITGGKLTTWRRMAKLAVDRLVEREAREAPCRTHEIPLGQAVAVADLPRVEGVPPESYAALAARYGYAAHEVLAIAAERGELAQPIVAGLPDLLAEAALAARREQARSIGDVLLRRTRLGLLAARELTGEGARRTPHDDSSAARESPGERGGLAAQDGPVVRVAAVLARELRWGSERTGEELERFAQEARAEGIDLT
ncbi:MAG TPA: glycerol-3-phosphate dehydrogenase/oxidase [Solirubrobacteraceae bacterium]|nr:glycerol-3-phosphate dehydrogenase/oxidase [Solirubrobacteraceae bacterium]